MKKKCKYLRNTWIQDSGTIFISLTTKDKERRGGNSIFRIVKHALLPRANSLLHIYVFPRVLFSRGGGDPIRRRSSGRRVTDKAVESQTKPIYRAGIQYPRGWKRERAHTELAEFNHISIWRTFFCFLSPLLLPPPLFPTKLPFFPRTKSSSNLLRAPVVDLCTTHHRIISMNQPV